MGWYAIKPKQPINIIVPGGNYNFCKEYSHRKLIPTDRP